MLNPFHKLFSTEKPPSLTEESRAFIEKLAPSAIWILAVGIRGTPKMPGTSGPEAREVVAAHRIELAEVGSKDSIFPFNYREDGRQILPFFSSEDNARAFLTAKKSNVGSFFKPHRLLAGFVAASEKFDPILDPGLPSERRLLPEEKALLRKITSRG